MTILTAYLSATDPACLFAGKTSSRTASRAPRVVCTQTRASCALHPHRTLHPPEAPHA
jgi:hypothetical protein